MAYLTNLAGRHKVSSVNSYSRLLKMRVSHKNLIGIDLYSKYRIGLFTLNQSYVFYSKTLSHSSFRGNKYYDIFASSDIVNHIYKHLDTDAQRKRVMRALSRSSPKFLETLLYTEAHALIIKKCFHHSSVRYLSDQGYLLSVDPESGHTFLTEYGVEFFNKLSYFLAKDLAQFRDVKTFPKYLNDAIDYNLKLNNDYEKT